MAKTKPRTRVESKRSTRTSIRVDSAVIVAVLDELNDLAELLRCLPELRLLSSFLRAHQVGEKAMQHDRIAAVAREHFGGDLDGIDEAERQQDAVTYDARFAIDPPLCASDVLGAPEAVTDAVRWRLQRLRAMLEMARDGGGPCRRMPATCSSG